MLLLGQQIGHTAVGANYQAEVSLATSTFIAKGLSSVADGTPK